MGKITNRLLAVILVSATLSSCNEDDDIDINSIVGSWYESYDDRIYAMDGSVTYTFNTENTYELRVYDVFSDEESVSSGQWVWSADEKGNAILWLYKNEAGETLDEMWEIVQLNGEEMTWQKVGTEYSIGTWGSDYKHFKRSE